jgi:hypothetical protein
MKKLVLQKNPVPANRIESVFSYAKCYGTKFQEFASIFVPRNREFSVGFSSERGGGVAGVKTTAQNISGPSGRYPSIN